MAKYNRSLNKKETIALLNLAEEESIATLRTYRDEEDLYTDNSDDWYDPDDHKNGYYFSEEYHGEILRNLFRCESLIMAYCNPN